MKDTHRVLLIIVLSLVLVTGVGLFGLESLSSVEGSASPEQIFRDPAESSTQNYYCDDEPTGILVVSSAQEQQESSYLLETSTPECPIDLPLPHEYVTYHRGQNIEVWNTQASAACDEYACDVLWALYDAGAELVEAGFLDLFGNNWGCVVQSDALGVLTVTLQTAQPSSGTASSARTVLLVTIVRTFVPEVEQ